MSQVDPPSYPQPIPVQPLAYSVGMEQYRRPALVTAIAVLCIVVACMSGLTSFVQGGYAFLFYMMSKAVSAVATMPAAVNTAGLTPPAAQMLQPGEAGTADNTLQQMLSLDAARVRELDKLLRAHGRVIFGIDDDTTLTAATIRAAVQSSSPAGSSPDSAATFTTSEGKIEVFPDHAVFTGDQGGTVIRTSTADNTDSERQTTSTAVSSTHVQVSAAGTSPAAATQPADTTLSPDEVDRVMAKIKRMAPSPLKPAQLTTIRNAISVPNQQLITPGISTSVTGTQIDGAGNVTVNFDGGMMMVDPTGRIITAISNRAFMTGMASTGFGISGKAAGAVIAEAIVSFFLAVYLFIVGILAFRTAGRNGRLLKTYALLKIPLAICAGVVIPWMAYEFANGVTRNAAVVTPAPPAPSIGPFIGWGVGIALAAMALPIGLLIALRAPSVRDYYSGQTMR